MKEYCFVTKSRSIFWKTLPEGGDLAYLCFLNEIGKGKYRMQWFKKAHVFEEYHEV